MIQNQLLVERTDTHLHIGGKVENFGNRTEQLHYRLKVERTGGSGTSNTSQSGSFTLPAGESTRLSTAKISIWYGDAGTIRLEIRNDLQELVSSSKMVYEIN